MINKDFFLALNDLEEQKGVKKEFFIETLESALVAAYKKNFGEARSVAVKLNPEKNTIKVYAYKTIVADDKVENAETQIALSEAKQIKKSYKVGDTIQEEITPKDFGRIAAGTAKQVITQKLREAERGYAYKELEDRLEQLVTAIIRRIENDTIFVEIVGSQIEGVLMANDQIPGEKYVIGERVKVYIKKIRENAKGSQAIVSRSTPIFVRKLFETEVPEIESGVVKIKNIVREAGYRTKIAVYSEDPSVDPVGACVGNKGIRVNNIVNELAGEKIDIIEYVQDPFEYIARALSPAKVLSVEVNDELKSSRVIVPDDKLSLAIGKSGQNVRLAAKLTNWKIDVKSVSQSVLSGEETKSDIVESEFLKEDTSDLFNDINLDSFDE